MPLLSVDGVSYVRLRHLARLYRVDHDAQPLVLGDALRRFEFEAETRRARYNGDVVWLHEAPRRSWAGWSISEADYRTLIAPLLRPVPFLGAVPSGPVVIDAGHGGHDTGARGTAGAVEKQLVLDVSRRIRERLRLGGIAATLTREGDRFIPLDERCRMATAAGAGLFLSVHFNASTNPRAVGVETYVMPAAGHRSTAGDRDPRTGAAAPGNRFDGANMILARFIHHQVLRTVRAPDRGVRRARFVVLREAPCPAVLVECGFLSNREEERKILSPAYREAIAAGIAAGIADYLGAVRRTQPTLRRPRAATSGRAGTPHDSRPAGYPGARG